MKALKIMLVISIVLVMGTSFAIAKPVLKGNNLYDGYDHEVWVDSETGEVTIIGHPTKEEKESIKQAYEKNRVDNERIRQERRADYDKAEDRKAYSGANNRYYN